MQRKYLSFTTHVLIKDCNFCFLNVHLATVFQEGSPFYGVIWGYFDPLQGVTKRMDGLT